jgi:ribonuclease HI
MLIWYHREADAAIRRMNHWDNSICLREYHKLRLVGEAEEIEACQSNHTHRRSWDCNCGSCVECREALGCQVPDTCYKREGRLLDQLLYKWDPYKSQPEDHKDQADGANDDDDWVLFDRQVMVTGQLGEIFRIFTEEEVMNEVPDMRLGEDNAPEEEIATNGSCFKNGYEDAIAGAGVFYGKDNPKNQAIRLPATLEQTNQTAEMVTMKEAVKSAGKNTDISKYVINAVTKDRQKREDWGCIGVANRDLERATIVELRKRKTKTQIKWVKSHNSHTRNEGADRKANEGARKDEGDEIETTIPPNL